MRILYKEPFKDAVVKDIGGSLQDIQELVGGYFQTVPIIPESRVLVLCNEEGKLLDLKPNIMLPYDVIVGNIMLMAMDGEELVGLSEQEIKIFTEYLGKIDISKME